MKSDSISKIFLKLTEVKKHFTEFQTNKNDLAILINNQLKNN